MQPTVLHDPTSGLQTQHPFPPQPQELLSAHQYGTKGQVHDPQFDLQHVVDAEAVDAAVSETPRPTKSVVPSRFRKRERLSGRSSISISCSTSSRTRKETAP